MRKPSSDHKYTIRRIHPPLPPSSTSKGRKVMQRVKRPSFLDSSSSDEEDNLFRRKTRLKNSRIEDYEIQKTSKVKKIQPHMNKISSFILKTDEYSDKYKTFPARKQCKSASKIASPFKSLTNDKYLIINPFRQTNDFQLEDTLSTITLSRRNIRHCLFSEKINSNFGVNETTLDDGLLSYLDNDKPYNYDKVVFIQSFYRGHILRKKLHFNYFIFSRILEATKNLNAFFIKKNKRILLKNTKIKAKEIEISLLKTVQRVKFSLDNYPKNYFKKKLGLNLEKKFLKIDYNNSFEILKGKEILDKKKEIKKLKKEIIDLKLDNKFFAISHFVWIVKSRIYPIMRKIFRITHKDEMGISNNINQIRKKQITQIFRKKEQSIKSILKNAFTAFRINCLNQKILILTKEKEKVEINLRKVIKVEEEKHLSQKELKNVFNNLFQNSISKQLKDMLQKSKLKKEEDSILKKQRAIAKIIISKETKFYNFFKNQFTKFYYRGLFRQMTQSDSSQIEKKEKKNKEEKQNEIPLENSVEKTMEDTKQKPKIDFKKRGRELRKMIANKNKSKKETLKIYFMKFYYAGIMTNMKRKLTKPRNTSEIIINNEKEITNNESLGNYSRNIITDEKLEEEIRKREIQLKEEQRIFENSKKMFYQRHRRQLMALKDKFSKWKLRAKLIRLKSMGLTKKKKIKKGGKKKGLKKSLNDDSLRISKTIPLKDDSNENDELKIMNTVQEDFNFGEDDEFKMSNSIQKNEEQKEDSTEFKMSDTIQMQ